MTHARKKAPVNRLKLAVQVFASAKLLGFGFKDMTVAYIGPGYENYEGKTVHQRDGHACSAPAQHRVSLM